MKLDSMTKNEEKNKLVGKRQEINTDLKMSRKGASIRNTQNIFKMLEECMSTMRKVMENTKKILLDL